MRAHVRRLRKLVVYRGAGVVRMPFWKGLGNFLSPVDAARRMRQAALLLFEYVLNSEKKL